MALTCTPSALVAASECLECGMTHKALLAALLYVQCTANGMNCTPSSLMSASTQLRESMTEKALLAALVYIQCTNNGGSGAGGTNDVAYVNNPNTEGLTPPNPALISFAGSPGKPIYTWTIPAGPWV